MFGTWASIGIGKPYHFFEEDNAISLCCEAAIVPSADKKKRVQIELRCFKCMEKKIRLHPINYYEKNLFEALKRAPNTVPVNTGGKE